MHREGLQLATSAIVRDRRAEISALMSGFTIETTPGSAAKIPDFREHLRPGTDVYVTFLAGSDFGATIEVAKRLRNEGFNPVPHIAARAIPSLTFLDNSLARLTGEANVDHVLTIAGALAQPIGKFADTMQLLATGMFDKHGIRNIGVAGHPEGSPTITEESIRTALKWKNDFANRTGANVYVTTQFCFEAAPLIAWDRRLHAEGNRLPIHIGIPGLATIKTLVAHANACGIGPSMRFISRQAMNVAKLLTVSAPDALITELSEYKATDARCGITRVHVYPLGGLKKSADWAYAVADGRIELKYGGNSGYAVGFEVQETVPASSRS
jgi:methylenetetrahydrofolate reductase (NADPH)